MSAFVFTLRVKVPKPSTTYLWREMIVVNSNVRIPDWVLNQIERIWPEVIIERLRQNHTLVFHTQHWSVVGDKVLRLLVSAPSNSRRHFPAQVITEERHTCKIIDWVQYPIIPR